MNEYTRTDAIPATFEDTFVAQNYPGEIQEMTREMSWESKAILKTLAINWANPKPEQLDMLIATIRTHAAEGLAAVCWRLRNSGLIFVGLDT